MITSCKWAIVMVIIVVATTALAAWITVTFIVSPRCRIDCHGCSDGDNSCRNGAVTAAMMQSSLAMLE